MSDSPQPRPEEPGAEPRAKLERLDAPAAGAGRRFWPLAAMFGAYWMANRSAALGFMPLDQSICFDGGWRILSGEVPLRDYLAPNGFTVHALQALFFALLGVDWGAYAAHAALMNVLAAWLVYRLLARFGVAPWAASLFMLASAVVFYPPFGAPYMDTHAFAFSLFALVAALDAALDGRESVRRRNAYYVGPLLALAYFSKQIPSVFFLAPCLAISAFAVNEKLATLRRMLVSLGLTAAALGLVAWSLGVDFALVDIYVRQLPTEEGARRLGYVPGVASVLRRFEETRVQLDLWSIAAVHAVGLPALLASLVFARRALRETTWSWRKPLGAAVLAEFLLLACLGFVALTSNDKELGVPLLFAAAGLACVALASGGAALGRKGIGRARAQALGLVVARDAWSFDTRVNETRKVNDLVFAPREPGAAHAELPEPFRPLQWAVPKLVTYTPEDLVALTDYLERREGAFFLVGDASVLYGMTGKPSVFPALWFHPGLTFPLPYDARFEDFETRLLERLQRFDVRTIVIEPRVWIGYRAPEGETPKARYVTLETFPRVAQWVSERRENERSFGAFRALELR
jgi:hypothetical protein